MRLMSFAARLYRFLLNLATAVSAAAEEPRRIAVAANFRGIAAAGVLPAQWRRDAGGGLP